MPRSRRRLSSSRSAISSNDSTLTREGHFVGTLLYASPEQIRGRVVDGRSDLYALGVLLYESAAATHPFEARELQAIVHRQPHPKFSAAK